MGTYTITLTAAQEKAMTVVAIDTQEWIQNAVNERARISAEEIIKSELNKALANGTQLAATADEIVMLAEVETALELNAKAQQELEARMAAGTS